MKVLMVLLIELVVAVAAVFFIGKYFARRSRDMHRKHRREMNDLERRIKDVRERHLRLALHGCDVDESVIRKIADYLL